MHNKCGWTNKQTDAENLQQTWSPAGKHHQILSLPARMLVVCGITY